MSTPPPAPRPTARERLRRAWAAFRSLMAELPFAAGIAILVLFVLLALSYPLLMRTAWANEGSIYHPVAGYDRTIRHPSGPTSGHPLGTDAIGRDVLSGLTYATSGTLVVALTAAVATGALSLVAGAAGAFWRGAVDSALSHLSDAMLLLPAPIALIAIGLARPGLLPPFWFGTVYGVLAGLGAAAVVIRSYGLSVMAKPFIEAARAAGGGAWHIIRIHLLPHLLPLAAIQMMLAVTGAIIVSGFVDFMTPGRTDRVGYGSLVYTGLAYEDALFGGVAWSVLLAGALGISLMCAAFYLISVGLRRRVDPGTGTMGLLG